MRTLSCSGCGGEIILDDSQEFGYCRYCGKKVIVKPRIIIDGIVKDMIENKIKSAETFWNTHKNREEALKLFNEIAREASSDYRGWWGLTRVYSNDFNDISCNRAAFETIRDAAIKAMNVAPPDVLPNLKRVWEQYTRQITAGDDRTRGESAGIRNSILPIQQKANGLQSQLQTLAQKRSAAQETIKALNAKSCNAMLGIVAGIIFFFVGELLYELFRIPRVIVYLGMFLVPACIFWKLSLSASTKVHQKNLANLNSQYQKLDSEYKEIVAHIQSVNNKIADLDAKIRILQ